MQTETEAPVTEPLAFQSVTRRFGAITALAGIDLELRAGELTVMADELGEMTDGAGTVVLRPARLSALRAAVGQFVESRDYAEWIRDEDREPLAITRELLWPLEQLGAEATRAALAPQDHRSFS